MSTIDTPCAAPSDCDAIGDGVVRFCYNATDNAPGFCDCSNWYGWVGELCDETTGTLIYARFVSIVSTIVTLTLILLTTRTIIFNLWIGFGPKEIDPVFYTGLSVLMSLIFLFLFHVFHIPATFDPSHFDISTLRVLIDEPRFIEDVVIKHGEFVVYCLLLSSAFQLIAAIFVVLSWNKVIEKASTFKSPADAIKAQRQTKRVFYFIGLYLFFLSFFLGFQLLQAAAFLISVSSISVCIVYFVAAQRLIKILEAINRKGEMAVELTLKLVKRVWFVNTVCLVIITIAALVYYIAFIDFDETLKLGEFNWIMLVRDIATFAGLVEVGYTSWYFNSVTDGIALTEEYPRLCYIFRWWDKKHFELLDAESPPEPKTLIEVEEENSRISGRI